MADNIKYAAEKPVEPKTLDQAEAGLIASQVESFVTDISMSRGNFEKRWYDNYFFDDGQHFRFVSRSTGKIVDLSNKDRDFGPLRAIPKASRQVRGIVNLLLSPEYVPIITPQPISYANFSDGTRDPQTGQIVISPEYKQAQDKSKLVAKRIGGWITSQWNDEDMLEKISLALILAAKSSVAWIQIYPDSFKQKISAQVYDGFDVYVQGDLNSPYDSPMIVKVCSVNIEKVKQNQAYDSIQRGMVMPDSQYAQSKTKNAYMSAKYGVKTDVEGTETVLLKEAYIKEIITDDNRARVKRDVGSVIFKELEKGKIVIRQVFVANGVWLRDVYTPLVEYPFVDIRLEPGSLYQTSLIERFIPANKSLDVLISRAERFANTMTTGTWFKRKGEDMTISNIPGGQVLEYTGQPPSQAQPSSIPSYYFRLMEMLEAIIEEQGATTAALGQLPPGVKSGTAIESLKSTEFANLKIPTEMLKTSLKRIAQRYIDLADRFFFEPQTVTLLDRGNPTYFDIVGGEAYSRKNDGAQPPEDVITIRKNYRVDIKVESGLGFTLEGKKDSMFKISEFMRVLAQEGYLTQDAVREVLNRFLEVCQYGPVQEFMEALDTGTQGNKLTNDQLSQMKIAVVEALKDAGVVGKPAQDSQITGTKIGVVEALKDTGALDKMGMGAGSQAKESISINYKDAPEDIKRQMEQDAGFQPSKTISPAGTEQIVKAHSVQKPNETVKIGGGK